MNAAKAAARMRSRTAVSPLSCLGFDFLAITISLTLRYRIVPSSLMRGGFKPIDATLLSPPRLINYGTVRYHNSPNCTGKDRLCHLQFCSESVQPSVWSLGER